ncbi:hypothetical protein MSAN_00281600 [Mycena sanguinolenta]|uniref:Uncharacterized protein n=1 Tax=Mycena sanguinolenta TaxID=230812 RepID=A0A8H6ZAJ6_9AGAR|nr:hypothetical protein MSAN_00281600 [Mycena sanguinolenta]
MLTVSAKSRFCPRLASHIDQPRPVHLIHPLPQADRYLSTHRTSLPFLPPFPRALRVPPSARLLDARNAMVSFFGNIITFFGQHTVSLSDVASPTKDWIEQSLHYPRAHILGGCTSHNGMLASVLLQKRKVDAACRQP